jgi:hypothetical protein
MRTMWKNANNWGSLKIFSERCCNIC